jgi:outer membrane receptor protein involved in Fe transport
MKVKFVLLLIAIGLATILAASSQSKYSIKGIATDSVSHQPAAYITVSLKLVNGNMLKNTLTKDDGSFFFENLLPGNYTISLFALGYSAKIIKVNAVNNPQPVINLNRILIIPKNTQLKEVNIKSSRPVVTQAIDRLIYDVQADPDNKGLSVLDVMQKVPLLSVDGDDNLQLKGSTDFKIYVNGRPSGAMASNAAQALRLMRSTNVKRIEVITTPSAKYESEGAAGIINIVTISDLEGYSIIFEIFRTSRIHTLGLGSAFTAKKGKFGINGYAGRFSHNALGSTFLNSRTSFAPYQLVTDDGNTSVSNWTLVPANADLSYEIDSLHLLTSTIVISANNYDQNNTQLFRTSDQQGKLINSYNINTTNDPKVAAVSANLNYQIGFKNKKDRLVTASYQYSTTLNKAGSLNNTIGNFNYTNNQLSQYNNAGMNEHTVQLDYIDPGKIVTTEAGAKLISRDNYSDFSTERVSSSGTFNNANSFDYGQNIYSLYNAYQFKFKDWGIYGGLRLEHTAVNAPGTVLNENYNNLIPSIIVQHKLVGKASLNLGYTQRIQRPGIVQLNPFENQVDPLYYTSGNPNLEPVLNNNFDLNYSIIKKATVNIGLNYSFANKTIQNVVVLGNDGITRTNYANIGKNDNLGANLSVNYPIAQNVKINFNGRTQYLWLTGTVSGRGYNNEGFSFTTNSSFSYTVATDWRFSFLMNTTTSVVSLQGKNNGYLNTVLTLNKEFFNKKLGLILRADNPTAKYRTSINRFDTPDFMQENISNRIMRGYYINIYYTIGHLTEKIKKNKRRVTNDDVDKGKTTDN